MVQGLKKFQKLQPRRLLVPFHVAADDLKKRFNGGFLLPADELGHCKVETQLVVAGVLCGFFLKPGKIARRLFALFG